MMKLYLYGETPFEDYLVIKPANPFKLEDEGLDKGELDGLFIDNVLELVPYAKVGEALQYFASFVKVGGELIVAGTDFFVVANNYVYGDWQIDTINNLIYGRGQQSVVTLNNVVDLLRGANFSVNTQRPVDHKYFVRSIRND